MGGGLPPWFEVIDAELMAVLMYLEAVVAGVEAEGGDVGATRCLVMSDCKSAMQMMETAWRGGGVERLAKAKRGGILEAICRARAKLELVVFMYVPAHRGVSMSAMADAAAKAYLEEDVGRGQAEWLADMLIRRREGREFGYQMTGAGGVTAPWHDNVFEMQKDAVGVWVRAREAGRVKTGAGARGTVMVDTGRLGLVDTAGNGVWWGEVMQGTGAEDRVERGEKRTEEAAAAEAGEVRQGNARQGIVAAMRNGGELRGATHGRWHREEVAKERARGEWGRACRSEAQGCPGCCSWARGWGWRAADGLTGAGGRAGEGVGRIWATTLGAEPVAADTAHIVGGRCRAVAAAVEGKAKALRMITDMWRITHLPRKRAKGEQDEGAWRVRPGLEAVVKVLSGARAALAGQAADAGREEEQWTCWRQLLAGALPKPGDEVSEMERKQMAKEMVCSIKSLQKEVAGWVGGWEEAARKEVGRRGEEDVGEEWGRGWFGAWRLRYLARRRARGGRKGGQGGSGGDGDTGRGQNGGAVTGGDGPGGREREEGGDGVGGEGSGQGEEGEAEDRGEAGESHGRGGEGRDEDGSGGGSAGGGGEARRGKRGREQEERGRRVERQRTAAGRQQPPQTPPAQAGRTEGGDEDEMVKERRMGDGQGGGADGTGGQQGAGAARAGSSVVTAPAASELAAAEALVQLANGGPAEAGGASQGGTQEGAEVAAGRAGRGKKRKDAAGAAQLAAEAGAVWWAKTRAAMCGVLRRAARKRARRGGGGRGGGAGSSSEHLAGSKRGASAMDAGDGSTDLQEVGGGINGKAPRVEYARRYPEREIEPERRAEATGPDRPKRKRVDGRACYANSGEGAKRRCDATGRPPGRPPG